MYQLIEKNPFTKYELMKDLETIGFLTSNFQTGLLELDFGSGVDLKLKSTNWKGNTLTITQNQDGNEIAKSESTGFWKQKNEITIFEKSREKHFSFKIENETLICFKVYQNEIPVFKFGVKSNKSNALANQIEVLDTHLTPKEIYILILIGFKFIGPAFMEMGVFGLELAL